MQFNHLRRREFITLIGGVATWPLAARAQQAAMPVVALVSARSAEASARYGSAFRKGLNETGYVEGQNVMVEYHWLEGQYNRLPSLTADLVSRRVAVIVTLVNTAALAAKATTTTTPIIFLINEDPVRLGLVTSLARPSANLTGINVFNSELVAKRLELLHELVPGAARIAVLVNPADAASTETTVRDAEAAARRIGLQINVLNANTSREVASAFESMAREAYGALFVAASPYFASRRVQLVQLAAFNHLPATYALREYIEAGGLMSYGANISDAIWQMGVYAGRILKGAKPEDLPVVQSSKLELVINVETARMLGLTVPPTLLATADEVIE
jgi:putative ABC transport system substrate-binding protein